MPYVTINPVDGEFYVKPMSDEDADRLMQQGGEVIHIEDDVYDAWCAHMKQHRVFHALFRQLRNDQFAREAHRNEGNRKP